MKSQEYDNILLKLGEHNLLSFTAFDLKEVLTKEEYTLLPEFIEKMLGIGMIKVIDEWNDNVEYEFTEKTFYTYYNILSSAELCD